MTTRELAERLGVTQRTAQRDLLHLQAELHVPRARSARAWEVASDFWLRPVIFNVHEAMAMLLSARLMLRSPTRTTPSPLPRMRRSPRPYPTR